MKKHKKMVFYEVDPRYFKDKTGNGVGDLQGFGNQMDYFDFLGVSGIFFQNLLSLTPKDKNQSFTTISSEIGQINDFKRVVSLAHEKDIRVFIELPIGRITNKHNWFVENEKNKSVFSEIVNTAERKENVENTENVKYKYSKNSNKYYLYDERTQEIPLNWKTDKVFRKFNQIIRFWNDLGVDGFVLADFENIANEKNVGEVMQNATLKELRKFYREVKEINPSLTVVAKSSKISLNESSNYTKDDSKVFDLFINQKISLTGTHKKNGNDQTGRFCTFSLARSIKRYVTGDTTTLAFGSSLTGRINSRWGDDGQYWEESAKCLAIVQFVNPASNVIYYGDEIGSLNIGLNHLDNFQDKTLNERKKVFLQRGGKEKKFMDAQVLQNPINARSLMSWNNKKNGGFSVAEKTIVPISSTYDQINVENQYLRKNSALVFYQKLIALVTEGPVSQVLNSGAFKISSWVPGLFKISVKRGKREVLAVVNLAKWNQKIWRPKIKTGKVVLSTMQHKEYQTLPTSLEPYEGVVISKQTDEAFEETQLVKLENQKQKQIEKVILQKQKKELEKEKTREIKIREINEQLKTKKRKNQEYFDKKEQEKKARELRKKEAGEARKAREIQRQKEVEEARKTREIQRQEKIEEKERAREQREKEVEETKKLEKEQKRVEKMNQEAKNKENGMNEPKNPQPDNLEHQKEKTAASNEAIRNINNEANEANEKESNTNQGKTQLNESEIASTTQINPDDFDNIYDLFEDDNGKEGKKNKK